MNESPFVLLFIFLSLPPMTSDTCTSMLVANSKGTEVAVASSPVRNGPGDDAEVVEERSVAIMTMH